MEPYLSSNGWIAWVAPDSILIDPLYADKGTFLIAGFDPLGNRQVSPKVYNTPEEVKNLIPTFDPQTVTFEYKDYLIRVFVCFDDSFWWHGTSVNGEEYPVKLIRCPKNMKHAVELTRYWLFTPKPDDEIPF
jgi:hypothetical protein